MYNKDKETTPLPKWMMRRYALLLKTFGEKEFTADECIAKLKEDKRIVLVLLSRLRKMGWLQSEFDQTDARKRKYKLVGIVKVLELMTK